MQRVERAAGYAGAVELALQAENKRTDLIVGADETAAEDAAIRKRARLAIPRNGVIGSAKFTAELRAEVKARPASNRRRRQRRG
jgi:hypothetical protein